MGLSAPFGSAFAGRRVLVTGHTGFKGSWLALWLTELGADVSGLALAPDTRPNHWDALGLRLTHDLRVDLRDAARVQQAVASVRPQIVFHLAAQPLVRRGYLEPTRTFETNVLGLVHLLQAVRECESVRIVLNATTDKVYLPPPPAAGYAEDDALGGHDPYSASKACAELVSACYRHSFFSGFEGGPPRCALYTARAGNVVGGGDWGEDRLIPDLVRAVTTGGALQLRHPGATRPWQHVLESLAGYLRIAQLGLAGRLASSSWNLGPAADQHLTVAEVVARLRRHWPGLSVSQQSGPALHEAPLLSLSSARARAELGWWSAWDAAATLEQTAAWYRDFLAHRPLRSRQTLAEYLQAASAAGLEWTR